MPNIGQWVSEVKADLKKRVKPASDPAVMATLRTKVAPNVSARENLAELQKMKEEKDPSKRMLLCETFLKRFSANPDPVVKKACAEVEDLLAQAHKEWGVEEAKKAYLLQMQKKADPDYNPDNKYDLKHTSERSQEAAKGDLSDKTGSGLSEAEVLAAQTYSLSDFSYINPAVANQKDKARKARDFRPKTDWMDANLPSVKPAATTQGPVDPDKKRPIPLNVRTAMRDQKRQELYEEGALHAGMLMEALKKLPKAEARIYRGRCMRPQDFAREYQVGKAFAYESFASTSTDEEVARAFSLGLNPQSSPPEDATVAVIVEAQVYDARDIEELSKAAGEQERLVLPGSTLRVDSIEDDTPSRSARIKAFKRVKCTQVFK